MSSGCEMLWASWMYVLSHVLDVMGDKYQFSFCKARMKKYNNNNNNNESNYSKVNTE